MFMRWRAALTDAVLAYLSLLYPPPGSYHDPVSASSVVFAGDSAGATLSLALLQVLLCKSAQRTIRFHGRSVKLPLPAGVTFLSAGGENTLCLPSWRTNAKYDIFNSDGWSYTRSDFPTCEIWPTNPPRCHVLCDADMLCHPLVSPALAKSWRGSPPMWFAGGQEMLGDSAKAAAEQAARQGVCVRFEEYEQMPHDFPIMTEKWPWAQTEDWWQSKRCMSEWARSCVVMAEGKELENGAIFVRLDQTVESVDVANLTGLSSEQIAEKAREAQKKFKPWYGTNVSPEKAEVQ